MMRAARAFLCVPSQLNWGVMEPTLLVGDWLFVNKLRLGPHIPFTNHSTECREERWRLARKLRVSASLSEAGAGGR